MKTYLFCIIASIFCLTANTQNFNLSSNNLPELLTNDANAIVRKHTIEITLEAVDKMVVKEFRAVTVLNKDGNKKVQAYVNYNNDTKVNNLSARVYDSNGKEIKKYSKSKFKDVSAVDGGTLYSDSRVKYLEHTPVAYPYTIIFESEYTNSTTGFIPSWYPVDTYSTSVESAEYKILNPQRLAIKTKEKNFGTYPIQKITKDPIHYKIENQPALKYENSSIGFSELMPCLLVGLNNFTLKGVPGKADNWKEFGLWMNDKLIKHNVSLNEATISEAKNLVKDIESDMDKAKAIYEFVQNKTRYISVQVGIGGWEPIPAKEVDKLGYGDCKGLTNYTKALLDAVGVESYHTLVYAPVHKDIDKDFSSLQGTHMILNLPNNGNDIWLECTSQIHPFGFLGSFTDDRNVLVITPEGGIIKRTTSYKNEDNIQTTKAKIELTKEGNVIGDVEITSKGIQYAYKFPIENKSEEDLKKYYTSDVWSYNNNLDVKSIEFQNDKDNIEFKENISVTINDYAKINENEFLFRVNVFNKNSYIPKRYRDRKFPLKIERGYKDVDEFTITIPENYSIQQLPPKKELDSKFGEYTMEIKKLDDKTLLYSKSIFIKEGVYPKTEYNSYRKFRKTIAKQENLRIALQKN
ncbi:DUF3857 domain-containing protein [Tenacibaculum agarivorans]|uniref:DUF3857 domain-containing protein n=1 Tax=Tenacibaculum agarivorans TaxID=1908389 RepID=UPI00094B8F80|nr:DUF3857 domain-containing protein [Tenacibaculum agarivorans]